MPPNQLRNLRTVVIGGGIIGCSVAYHLVQRGETAVTVVEQNKLSGGTTWHAAGLVGQLRSSENMTRLIRHSVALYRDLEAETGLSTGWRQCGSLTVARKPERMTQLRRQAALAQAFGIEARIIDVAEAAQRFPVMRTDDLLGAVWLPGDGKANPVDLVQSLARGARMGGATIQEETRVLGLDVANGKIRAVKTTAGDIPCTRVVFCTGMWSWQLGRQVGFRAPLHPTHHFYMVSEAIAGVARDLPVMRDPDGHIYFKEETGGLVAGGFEPASRPWCPDPIPSDFSFSLLNDDTEQFQLLIDQALHRVPGLADVGIRQMVNGPESFTPDNNFLLGPAPGLDNGFVVAGFNSAGIASAGGAGKAAADWLVDGAAPFDLSAVDPRRFGPWHNDLGFLRDRVVEVPGLHYRMAWPNREFESGRGLRKSPLYDGLRAKGAFFTDKMGYERAAWFAPNGSLPVPGYTFGRPHWLALAGDEHRCVRQGVGLIDQSSFTKLFLEGPDALAVLQWLCSTDMDIPVGRLTYTAMLNPRGGFEADLTVFRLAPTRFLLIGSAARAVRDPDWITGNAPSGARFTLRDATMDLATIGICGPKARDLLARLTDQDLGNQASPLGSVADMALAGTPVRAARIAYGGELGWEIYVPVGAAALLYDALMGEGADLGLRDIGYAALDSLRLEKAYRAWGSDLTPDDTPLETGLGFLAGLKKQQDFVGRAVMHRQKADGVRRRLVLFRLAPTELMAWGGEPLRRDGQLVGKVTSTGIGHTIGAALAFAWINQDRPFGKDWIATGQYSIDIAGQQVAATPLGEAPYDPEGLRRLG